MSATVGTKRFGTRTTTTEAPSDQNVMPKNASQFIDMAS